MGGRPPQLGIQTSVSVKAKPPQAVTSTGILIVAWTAFVIGSIRTTAEAFGTLTQMLPNPLPSQFGPELPVGPTVIVATILFVAGSMRRTLPSCVSATHTAASVARTPFGAFTDRDRRDDLEAGRVDAVERGRVPLRDPDAVRADRDAL